MDAILPETRNHKLKTSSGFTLVEILIALFIIGLLSTILTGVLSKYRDRQALSTASETILTALSEARQKTLSLENNMQYGVYFDKSRVVIFPGTVFSEPNSLNQEFPLESAVNISTTSLVTSTSTVVFSKVTGAVSNYGSVTVSLKSSTSTNKVINISASGGVSN